MVYPDTATHPSINRARHRVTTLIETNALPLSQATTYLLLVRIIVVACFVKHHRCISTAWSSCCVVQFNIYISRASDA